MSQYPVNQLCFKEVFFFSPYKDVFYVSLVDRDFLNLDF